MLKIIFLIQTQQILNSEKIFIFIQLTNLTNY